MKKKIWMSLGITALAVVTLSACSTKNSDAAKKAFISDTVALNNSKEYNAQNVKLDVNEFKLHGEDSSEFNKMFSKGTHLNVNLGLDKTNQLAALAGTITLDKKDYNLGVMMSQKGLYLASTDIKSLYNNNKDLIPSEDSDTAMVYGAMIDSLNKEYLLIDSETIDSSAQSVDENWSSTFKDLFKSTEKIKQADLEKEFKKIPNSDFTKDGDKVTLKFSGKDIDLKDSVKFVIDNKAHKMTSTISGSITNTKEKASADLNLSLSSTRSKLKKAIKEPAATDTNTLEEVQNAAIEKIMAQASAAY